VASDPGGSTEGEKEVGRKVMLPSVRRFQEEDPVPEGVLNQILLGVSP
jgi:hypothetical protein